MSNKTISLIFGALLLANSSNCLSEELSLKTALIEAAKNSPQIQKSQAAYDEAGWKKVEAYSGFLPSVSSSATYFTNAQYVFTNLVFQGQPVSFPGIVPTSTISLNAQLPIFD